MSAKRFISKTDANEELRRSELRLQKAQELAHVGNWEIDLSNHIMWGSEEALKIYGFDHNKNKISLELVQKSPLPEYRPKLDEALNRLILYNEPYEVEFKIKRADDGEIRHLYSKAEMAVSVESGFKKVIGVVQDITDRKNSEEALNRNEKEFQNYFDLVAVGMSVTNADRIWIKVNQKLSQILGYSKEELIGKDWYELTYPEDRKANMVLFHMAINGEIDNYELDKRFVCKDGRIVFITISVVCQRNPDRTVSHFLTSYIDITERNHFEKELVKAKEKAEESDRLKTAFLHNISHEIRTPMNAIIGFTSLLNENNMDPASRESYIKVISESSDHLLSIISDIVDISSVEAELVKINMEEFNLDTIFKTIYDLHSQKAKEKGIEFIYDTGFINSDATIVTDKTKLIQILSNLVSNAIKFTHEGKVRYSYKLKLALIEFTVSDTGIGIPSDQQSRIFDRFYQVHNQASRTYEGTGLGLAISKAYVELMGGTIKVISEPGAGSSFIFTIPYEKRKELMKNQSTGTGRDKFYFTVRKNILVVEDVESNFQLIKYFLTGTNAEIIRAVNGQEAVNYCMYNKRIDLILMDIKMPIMDGYTATKILRENNISIPIIAQTAYADDKENALKAGCSAFISKPFDKKGLLSIINELI
jgi:PAS domain S-box-containing protein